MPEIALHILDLAENCVKAGAGHVIITVSLEGDQLCVTIEDDGCGMDEALLARVEISRFIRSLRVRSTKTSSSRLG